MPDITMCHGSGGIIVNGKLKLGEKVPSVTECPKKELCYRFKAKTSDYRQAFFVGIPYDPATEANCEHFLPFHKKKAGEDLDRPVIEDVIKLLKGQSHDN